MPPSEIEQMRKTQERIEGLLIALNESTARQHQTMSAQITRLSTSVLGDREAGVDGIAQRTGELEQYVEDDKIYKSNWKGRISVILFIVTPAIGLMTSLLFWYATKHQ